MKSVEIGNKALTDYSKIEQNDFTQTINWSKNLFPKGISKITLLDTTFNQFAERLIFVDDGKADLIKLQFNKQEFKPREEVNIGAEALISPGDSINSTLSVAIVNKNYFGSGGNSQNIKSYLLLDSDLKGAIELPALYFIDDELISSGEKLDLLMMVNGWRSYLWDDIEAAKTPSLDDWNDAGIEIKGFAKKLLWKGPQPDAELTLASGGGNFTIEKTISDEQGRFNFKRIYLSNITRVTINALTKRGFHKAPKFYSPSYTLDNINNPQPDYRPTLLWDPELDIKSGKANIGFFTSDELSQYVVFVEGITKNGKICFGTTSFTVDKK